MTSESNVSAQIETDEEKICIFPHGIPGFEKYTKYHVFHKEENNYTAYWLESVDMPSLIFTLIDPTVYGLNYELVLTDEEQEVLQTENHEDIAVFMMLSKKDGQGEGLNANIAGPVLINVAKNRGLQKVIARSQVNVNIVEK